VFDTIPLVITLVDELLVIEIRVKASIVDLRSAYLSRLFVGRSQVL
jgi:hypothetical protein